jgi:hypothetical protein
MCCKHGPQCGGIKKSWVLLRVCPLKGWWKVEVHSSSTQQFSQRLLIIKKTPPPPLTAGTENMIVMPLSLVMENNIKM